MQSPGPTTAEEKEKVIRLNKLCFSPNSLLFRLSLEYKLQAVNKRRKYKKKETCPYFSLKFHWHKELDLMFVNATAYTNTVQSNTQRLTRLGPVSLSPWPTKSLRKFPLIFSKGNETIHASDNISKVKVWPASSA